MKFALSINMDNAAFGDGEELPRILAELAEELAWKQRNKLGKGTLFDINGNTVGEWGVVEERSAAVVANGVLRDIEALCEQGLNSVFPRHWEAALQDILGTVRSANSVRGEEPKAVLPLVHRGCGGLVVWDGTFDSNHSEISIHDSNNCNECGQEDPETYQPAFEGDKG